MKTAAWILFLTILRPAMLRGDVISSEPPARPFTHTLILHDRPWRLRGEADSSAPTEVSFESEAIEAPRPGNGFNEALISWNAAVPAGGGMRVDVRVGRRGEDAWSPYLEIGTWGMNLPAGKAPKECASGAVNIDYFTSSERFDRLQYRIRARLPEDTSSMLVRRVAVCLSDTRAMPEPLVPGPPSPPERAPAPFRWQRRLYVPLRSQFETPGPLAGRICSPTSVAMVMAYRGVDVPTLDAARVIYDAEHDIYGNWPRAVQGAYTYGIPGYLARFSAWHDVERCIAGGQPLIISTRVEKGDILTAPQTTWDGHLMVLTGFDKQGDVEINNPARWPPQSIRQKYLRDDLERIWMRNAAGTAYVLLPPENPD